MEHVIVSSSVTRWTWALCRGDLLKFLWCVTSWCSFKTCSFTADIAVVTVQLQYELKPAAHHPMLNSTCASKRATTGAEAALHPLTLDLISPSCLSWRTTLMKPGLCWALVSSTKLCRCSFSSTVHRETHKYMLKQTHWSLLEYQLYRQGSTESPSASGHWENALLLLRCVCN